MNQFVWLTLASSFALVGSIWQCISAASAGLESMRSFLGAHNAILLEEQRRIRLEVPVWRFRKRQRAFKDAEQEADVVLTGDERRLSRAYDRQAIGWSFVTVGSLIACVVSWEQAFS